MSKTFRQADMKSLTSYISVEKIYLPKFLVSLFSLPSIISRIFDSNFIAVGLFYVQAESRLEPPSDFA